MNSNELKNMDSVQITSLFSKSFLANVDYTFAYNYNVDVYDVFEMFMMGNI